jgi:hypothetical protein
MFSITRGHRLSSCRLCVHVERGVGGPAFNVLPLQCMVGTELSFSKLLVNAIPNCFASFSSGVFFADINVQTIQIHFFSIVKIWKLEALYFGGQLRFLTG